MTVLILTNHQIGLYKFRKEILEELVANNYEVYVSVPEEEFTEELRLLQIKIINNKYLERRGTNPVHDVRLLQYYNWLLKKIKPDIVLSYTVKPNSYGGFLCGKLKIPYIANVTGLGTAIQNGGFIRIVTSTLYRIGLSKARKVFFQNEENRKYMVEHRLVKREKTDILPGSGVNTAQHRYEPYPPYDGKIVFSTIGRIMKDKGTDEVLAAAEVIHKKYPNTIFRLIGDYDEDYKYKVSTMESNGIIEYLGFQKDIHSIIASSHAVIHASYHEGMSNVLLESASTGRPVIASNVHGCVETLEPDVTGITFEPKDTEGLVNAIEKFLAIPYEEKEKMGKAGREKIKKEFDRGIVIHKYMVEIQKVREEQKGR